MTQTTAAGGRTAEETLQKINAVCRQTHKRKHSKGFLYPEEGIALIEEILSDAAIAKTGGV